jgi:hypothetical protein
MAIALHDVSSSPGTNLDPIIASTSSGFDLTHLFAIELDGESDSSVHVSKRLSPHIDADFGEVGDVDGLRQSEGTGRRGRLADGLEVVIPAVGGGSGF